MVTLNTIRKEVRLARETYKDILIDAVKNIFAKVAETRGLGETDFVEVKLKTPILMTNSAIDKHNHLTTDTRIVTRLDYRKERISTTHSNYVILLQSDINDMRGAYLTDFSTKGLETILDALLNFCKQNDIA